MNFSELKLSEPILRAVASEGYTIATPIQVQAIPHALDGRDVLGCAQTGTGKTAAFALPILHRLDASPRTSGRLIRCLVLCPTRELANQTADSFRVYGKNLKISSFVIYGGVGQNPQVMAIRKGVDVLVATPGRLMDLMNQGFVDLRGVEILVLDEADRMLDMGFINDIRKIVSKLPPKKQTLFFSATMPAEIRQLADGLLRNAVNIQVTPTTATADNVDESVYFVARNDKGSLLAHLYNDLPMTRTIVFTRTKRGADRVVKRLHESGIKAEAIHGDKSQNARERALHNFKVNKTPILVATDIASRGIDVDGITHVVNYDLTHEPETYIHRIGRTARAGAAGCAVSFCDTEELDNLKAIERLIRRRIPVKTAAGFRKLGQTAPSSPAGPHGHRDHDRSRPRHGAHATPARPFQASERAGHAAAPRHAAASHAAPTRHAAASHAAPARHPLTRHAQLDARRAAGKSNARPAPVGAGVMSSHQGAKKSFPHAARRNPKA